MKTLLLFLLFSLPGFAQNGFRMEKGKIVWEHVYTTAADINTLIANASGLSTTATEGSLYTGKGKEVKNTTETESIRLKCNADFNFTITAVPNGYVVKVTNFVFLEKYGPLQMRVVPNSLDKYYMEYGKIRQTPKTQADLNVVDGFLAGVFAVQPAANAIEPAAITAK